MNFATAPRSDAANNIRAIFDHVGRMKRPDAARHALYDHAGIFGNQNSHNLILMQRLWGGQRQRQRRLRPRCRRKSAAGQSFE